MLRRDRVIILLVILSHLNSQAIGHLHFSKSTLIISLTRHTALLYRITFRSIKFQHIPRLICIEIFLIIFGIWELIYFMFFLTFVISSADRLTLLLDH